MNEENNGINNSGNTVKVVLITLLVVVLIGLIGFIVYDKVIKKDATPKANNSIVGVYKSNEIEQEYPISTDVSSSENVTYGTMLVNDYIAFYDDNTFMFEDNSTSYSYGYVYKGNYSLDNDNVNLYNFSVVSGDTLGEDISILNVNTSMKDLKNLKINMSYKNSELAINTYLFSKISNDPSSYTMLQN